MFSLALGSTHPDCDASTFATNVDTDITAYVKTTTADVPSCCAACSKDAKCDFFSFDGTSAKNNCHHKKGSPVGHTLARASFTTSTPAPAPPPPPTPAPTPGPHWGSRPNIVVFFSDDTGWGDLGANGGAFDSAAVPSETPHLDGLAAAGLRLTDFHTGASVCTPSRAALLTGRLGLRTGVTHNFGVASTMGLDRNESTIAEVLKGAGYDTKMIGKWHLGHHPGYHPSYRGFDKYVGLPYSNDMGCLDQRPTTGWNWEHGADGHAAACGADGGGGHAGVNGGAGPAVWGDAPPNGITNAVPLYNSTAPGCAAKSASGDCNADIAEQPVQLETLNSRYAAEAVAFVAEHAAAIAAANPFFLYMPFAHMHVPHGFAPQFVNASARKTILGDTLRELDHAVGVVLAAVRAGGLEDKTLILYTGDNGPWNVKCDLAGSQGPFLGSWQAEHGGGGGTGKFTTWEGGHREPAIAYWKGKVAPGVSGALASTLDFMPTFAALAGTPLPAGRSWDGRDLAPVLFGSGEAQRGNGSHHRFLFHPNGQGALNAMRWGELKVFFQTYSANGCGKKDDHGQHYTATPHDPPLIFNLTADPAESTPVTVGADVLAAIKAQRAATLADIAGTLKHPGHYDSGDKKDWGCCNQESAVCRCKGQNPHGTTTAN